MEILNSSHILTMRAYFAQLRAQMAEWTMVEIKIIPSLKLKASTGDLSQGLCHIFSEYEGRIVICNPTEILMLIRWGTVKTPQALVDEVSDVMPADSCDISISPPSPNSLRKIEFFLASPEINNNMLYKTRKSRDKNVFLIADDDMYMRLLAKKVLGEFGVVFEVTEGDKVIEAYKRYNPNMLLLDIHMPGLNGIDILMQLKTLDPRAYVVMLSADSSPENVRFTKQSGAKGFLSKPFDKARLTEYIQICPTFMPAVQS